MAISAQTDQSLTKTLLPQRERPAWLNEAVGNATGRHVRIGVIDSGWDHTLDAPQLQPGVGLVHPEDELALYYSDDTQDRHGHGTACSDLILQRAPDVLLYPIRVFGHRIETSISILQAAILWAAEHQLDLVNISLGTNRLDALETLYAACEIAHRADVILVAAMHNHEVWSYPASFDNVISVGTTMLDHPFDYQYWPGEMTECLAKSKQQTARSLGGRRTQTGGTSFAAPNITGFIALLLERHPDASLSDIRNLLARYALPAK